MNVIVDFACNDYRNGDFTGRCEAINLPDGSLDLHCGELGYGAGVTFKEDGEFLFFGRVKVKPLGCRRWAGNWCWDAFRLTVEDAAKILNYCKKSGWQLEGGWCELCDIWDARDISADDLVRAYRTEPQA